MLHENRRAMLKHIVAGGGLLCIGGSASAQQPKTNEKRTKIDPKTLVARIDRETGKELWGALVWTPLADEINPELVYVPDATEYIPISREPVSEQTKMPHLHSHLPDDEPVGKALRTPQPLREVCRYYTGACDGGDDYPNDCAHFLSNAFIRAGYSDLLTSSLITERCSSGAKRAIRAYDMLRWFQSKASEFRSGVIPQGNGIWATYQEKPGWKHVLISDTDLWQYCGTGDYPDWPTQYNYRW